MSLTPRKIYSVYFSPTGSSRLAARSVAYALRSELDADAEDIDLTPPAARSVQYHFTDADTVVIAMPVYAGRLPNKIAPDIARCLHGGGSTKLIALCTYGKRSARDAERELLLIASQNGFVPIAARSIVCEHAFSAKIAHGRPNAADLAQLASFGADIARRIASGAASPLPFDADTPLAPYYTPLKEDGTGAHFLKAKPVTDASRCTRCGICAFVCPMGSIAADEPDSTAGICIKCQACIKACPARARRFLDGDFLSHVKMLENTLGD